MPVKSSFEILAVENISAYGLLLEHALSPLQVSLTLFSDVSEARHYLTGCALRGTIPDALMLDLQVLRSSGLDLLRWIRAQRPLQGLPVVVLSGCDDASDVNRAYELGIAAYVARRAGIRELAMTLSGVLVSRAASTERQGYSLTSTSSISTLPSGAASS
jgi:DNA-binding response OmpR family regulator